MNLTSEAFEDRGEIPSIYTCDGEDVSPPLSISDTPSGARSLALVADDSDAPGSIFDHWIVWNIPPETTFIPENVPPEKRVKSLGGAKQGKNDFDEIGYRGPCPPRDPSHSSHRYRFKLYALDIELDLKPGILKEDLKREMEGYVIAEDEIVGVYGR